MRNLLAGLALFAALGSTQALAIGEDDFLPPEQAFKYTASADEKQVTVEWQATKGYYLYKKRMGLSAATPGVTVGDSVYPKGDVHKDDYFGEQEVFRGNFKVTAPLTGAKAGDTVALKIKWQGCADAGLCYPPTVWDASVKVAGTAAASTTSTADKIFAERERAKPAAGAVASAADSGDEDFVDPDVAFVLTAEAKSANNIQLNWRIADGYYLYKKRIQLASADAAHPVGAIVLPKGLPHSDEYFGEQEVYRQSLDASFTLQPSASKSEVTVTYQGCADAGLCYPPITKRITIGTDGAISIAGATGPTSPIATAVAANKPTAASTVDPDCMPSEQDSWAEKIKNGNLLLVLLGFFGTGLLLAFTPCVLPMVPILSGIIAGSGENVSTRRSFMLSVSYVLGMALTYTAAGIAAGAIGKGFNLQATFNQPWILILFSLLFVVLAASMFGLFTIEMPNFIQTRLSDTSNKQQAGTYAGVAVMGALSALIVSACVAPPLIAALTVISQTGEIARGGAALFAMSLGMGTPLLLVGASAGKLLPKAGAWMETVKNVFGVLFLAVAAWMLSRIAPERAILPLWSVPAFALAWVLWRSMRKPTTGAYVLRAGGVLAGLAGVTLLAGAALGGTDPLSPIPQLATPKTPLEFKRIKTLADLERELAAANAAGKTVMLDFYADWCVSCKEMEHYTFNQPDVKQVLANTVALQADVTAADDQDRELLQHFGIFGPPTIAFYTVDGVEQRGLRVVGFQDTEKFKRQAKAALSGQCSPKT